MLTGQFEVGAGFVNLSLRDAVNRQSVECLLKVLDVVGQISICRNDDVVDNASQYLTQIVLLILRQFGIGNYLVGVLERTDHAGTGVDGVLSITTILIHVFGLVVVVIIVTT